MPARPSASIGSRSEPPGGHHPPPNGLVASTSTDVEIARQRQVLESVVEDEAVGPRLRSLQQGLPAGESVGIHALRHVRQPAFQDAALVVVAVAAAQDRGTLAARLQLATRVDDERGFSGAAKGQVADRDHRKRQAAPASRPFAGATPGAACVEKREGANRRPIQRHRYRRTACRTRCSSRIPAQFRSYSSARSRAVRGAP